MAKSHPIEHELVAAMLLQVLRHADDPQLVQEAISAKPNPDKLHQLLVAHNERQHSALRSQHQVGTADNQIQQAVNNPDARPDSALMSTLQQASTDRKNYRRSGR